MNNAMTEEQQAVELSIIMPCLNEAETLKICIQKAKDFLVNNKIKGEILVGDNGSTDGSQQIAIALGVRLIDVPLKGYGAALYYASLEAKGKYLIMGDSDGSYDFSNLLPFLNKLREGYELVMGNRFSGGIGKGAMPWKNRYLGCFSKNGSEDHRDGVCFRNGH
jgi:glycosyltransferase involved in cell wall biosynthesis